MRGDWVDFRNPLCSGLYMRTLARNGWVAEKCYTSSPQCIPARMSWITGIRPRILGVDKNEKITLREDSPSVIRVFKEKGWDTALIGKTHWTPHTKDVDLRENQKLLERLGFRYCVEIGGPRALKEIRCELTEEWEKEGYMEEYKKDLNIRYSRRRTKETWRVKPTILPDHLYPDIWIAEKSIKYLKEVGSGTPWLLWVSFVGPHEPFDTPRKWKKEISERIIPKQIETAEWIKREADIGNTRNIYEGWKGKLSHDDIKDIRKDYTNRVQLLDDQVKRIVNEVRCRNELDNTDIVITADHGEMLGDHEMLYKSTFLEGAVHVPFMYIPSDKRNKLCNIATKQQVGLTKIFKEVLKDSRRQLQGKKIKDHLDKNKVVEIRYDKETCLIKNGIKVVFDKEGKVLWATNIRRNKLEQKNIRDDRRFTRIIERIKHIYISKIKEQGKSCQKYVKRID